MAIMIELEEQMDDKTVDTGTGGKKDAFAQVALWQFLSFFLLLCFVWAVEYFDIPHVLGAPETPFNWVRVSILSGAVITAAIVTVGHAYEQQKSIVDKLLMSCLYCHKVQTGSDNWENIEEYFLQHYPIEMERGACPDCKVMLTDLDSHLESITPDEPGSDDQVLADILDPAKES
jgi:hypothetical protein